jgi:hypothetical protein
MEKRAEHMVVVIALAIMILVLGWPLLTLVRWMTN